MLIGELLSIFASRFRDLRALEAEEVRKSAWASGSFIASKNFCWLEDWQRVFSFLMIDH